MLEVKIELRSFGSVLDTYKIDLPENCSTEEVIKYVKENIDDILSEKKSTFTYRDVDWEIEVDTTDPVLYIDGEYVFLNE